MLITIPYQGSCYVNQPGSLLANVIKVVHFGLTGQNLDWREPVEKNHGCIRHERDIVTPPVADLQVKCKCCIALGLEVSIRPQPHNFVQVRPCHPSITIAHSL